jgi:hypothetical protein
LRRFALQVVQPVAEEEEGNDVSNSHVGEQRRMIIKNARS